MLNVIFLVIFVVLFAFVLARDFSPKFPKEFSSYGTGKRTAVSTDRISMWLRLTLFLMLILYALCHMY